MLRAIFDIVFGFGVLAYFSRGLIKNFGISSYLFLVVGACLFYIGCFSGEIPFGVIGLILLLVFFIKSCKQSFENPSAYNFLKHTTKKNIEEENEYGIKK